MLQYDWNGMYAGLTGMAFGSLLAADLGLRELPEAVRAALEERQEAIYTAEDARRIAEELMLRR